MLPEPALSLLLAQTQWPDRIVHSFDLTHGVAAALRECPEARRTCLREFGRGLPERWAGGAEDLRKVAALFARPPRRTYR